jgi:Protein of unknown function (DUF3027)
MTKMHNQLLTIVKRLPSDFEPYGNRSRDEDWGPDCSCGCKYFIPLEGTLGMDWGVCANPASPRVGLLTFEHQGCKAFEDDEDLNVEFKVRRMGQKSVPIPDNDDGHGLPPFAHPTN